MESPIGSWFQNMFGWLHGRHIMAQGLAEESFLAYGFCDKQGKNARAVGMKNQTEKATSPSPKEKYLERFFYQSPG